MKTEWQKVWRRKAGRRPRRHPEKMAWDKRKDLASSELGSVTSRCKTQAAGAMGLLRGSLSPPLSHLPSDAPQTPLHPPLPTARASLGGVDQADPCHQLSRSHSSVTLPRREPSLPVFSLIPLPPPPPSLLYFRNGDGNSYS